MKLQERVNEANINETVADIIVAEVRAYFRKTGDKTRSYDEFTIQEIAARCGDREEFFQVSARGVANVLNSVKGIKARFPARRFWRCGGYGLKRFNSLRVQNFLSLPNGG